MGEKYDFSGYATRNDLKCSDGRIIRRDAFKDQDGVTVPLVFQHNHTDLDNVLGHALLENREDGVYAYGKFNETEAGRKAKIAVRNRDITKLSIYANQLKQHGADVVHGAIREVSLVLAGANPGAIIDFPFLSHSGEMIDDEAIIYTPDDYVLEHMEDEEEPEDISMKENNKMPRNDEFEHSDDDKTVEDVINTMNEEQKQALYYLLSEALNDNGDDADDESEDEEVKHNVFESDLRDEENVLSHADEMTIINDAKKYGSLKESFLAHADEYGIENIEYLFPDARSLDVPPQFIQREQDWVGRVMNGTHHSPFSRVKSMFANITEDEARAKGYIKGKLKKEEVFSLLKRSTDPQTIYKKQKLDRDDVIDITDFDVVAWLKSEMRMMLDEEIARAILIGDGRLPSDDDHISEDHIRPIAKDADLFTVKIGVGSSAADANLAKDFIKGAIRSRKNYKGSGNPVLFTTEDMLTEMLLIEDGIGHYLYPNASALATALRVSDIITVPVMEGQKITVDSEESNMLGIIVNLKDYNVGADKGGAISMFEDFDIDYNQQKYLIETRCSGALIKPFSAIVITDGTKNSSTVIPTEITGATGNTGATGATGNTGATGAQG